MRIFGIQIGFLVVLVLRVLVCEIQLEVFGTGTGRTTAEAGYMKLYILGGKVSVFIDYRRHLSAPRSAVQLGIITTSANTQALGARLGNRMSQQWSEPC